MRCSAAPAVVLGWLLLCGSAAAAEPGACDCGGRLPTVRTRAEVEARMGQRAVLYGRLERAPMRRGESKPGLGTWLVLADGGRVVVTYGEPPPEWGALIGQPVCVRAKLVPRSPLHPQSLRAAHLSEWDFPVRHDPAEGAMSETRIRDRLGQQVSLTGIARDAKGGAVLVLDSGETVYVEKLDAWPEALHGRRVTVSGSLRRYQYLPLATVAPDGAVSQGTFGKQDVLCGAEWRLAEP